MSERRRTRWERIERRRMRGVRRSLSLGASVGLVACPASLAYVELGGDVPGSMALVRIAMLIPAGLFLVYWLLIGPGWSIDTSAKAAAPTVTDMDEVTSRARQLEHMFEREAAPAARRSVQADDLEWYRASMRTDGRGAVADPTAWGLSARIVQTKRDVAG